LRCAGEWGGWGRISVDGPGQHNPDRSEGPWGRAAAVARMVVLGDAGGRRRRTAAESLRGASTKDGGKPGLGTGMPGAGLTGRNFGKALSETPALEPYWGKPAVRNLREDNGNVGIMRSPVRAIVLPDRQVQASLVRSDKLAR
jgi:hypothetical protein